MKSLWFPFAVLLLAGLGGYIILFDEDSEPSEEVAAELVADGETITRQEAEAAVRQLVVLDDAEFKAAIFVNSEEAKDNLQSLAGKFIFDFTEVGDFFLIFDSKQVLYRPSSKKVVHIVPVVQGNASEESDSELSEVPVETTSVSVAELGE